MNQKKFFAALLFSILLILVGCQNGADNNTTKENGNTTNQGTDTAQEEEVQALTASIELLDLEDNEVDAKTVEFEEGQSLMDVLKENYEVDETDGFINGVDELVANSEEQQFISIEVNGELAVVGANELILEDGDEISLSLEVWE